MTPVCSSKALCCCTGSATGGNAKRTFYQLTCDRIVLVFSNASESGLRLVPQPAEGRHFIDSLASMLLPGFMYFANVDCSFLLLVTNLPMSVQTCLRSAEAGW